LRTQENRLVAVTNSLARILVAEDETSLNDLLQDALRMNGYETISAKHGLEALRLIREEKPDLVILDINMPQLDGFGVIEKLRNENNNVPVIVLTARDQNDDKSIGFGLGADDFVTKPFGLEECTNARHCCFKKIEKHSYFRKYFSKWRYLLRYFKLSSQCER
jgi:two-component system, OmpR family, response regulator